MNKIIPIGLVISLALMALSTYRLMSTSDATKQEETERSLGEVTSTESLPSPTSIPPLQLQQFFDDNFNFDQAGAAQWRLIVGGDYNPGRSVNTKILEQGDFSFMLANVLDIFKQADLSLINLEGTLLTECPSMDEGMRFCGNAGQVQALFDAGIDVASLANNHSLNFGSEGLLETREILKTAGIADVGFMEYRILEVKGTRVAIVGIDAVSEPVDQAELKELMQKVATEADLVIPYFHWGQEYVTEPNELQVELAHLAVDAGADLVLGAHPHWVQSTEIYNNVLIVYSHGNLVFDQLWSEETREGIIGDYVFVEDKLVDARFMPIYINPSYQPELADDARSEKILERMQQASKI